MYGVSFPVVNLVQMVCAGSRPLKHPVRDRETEALGLVLCRNFPPTKRCKKRLTKFA